MTIIFKGNAYRLENYVLMSGPVLANGQVSTQEDEWCEVEDLDLVPDTIKLAFGLI